MDNNTNSNSNHLNSDDKANIFMPSPDDLWSSFSCSENNLHEEEEEKHISMLLGLDDEDQTEVVKADEGSSSSITSVEDMTNMPDHQVIPEYNTPEQLSLLSINSINFIYIYINFIYHIFFSLIMFTHYYS